MTHVRSLTGARFLAAIWVVGFHYREMASDLCPSITSLDWLLSKGYMAVPFFFVLSGYILSHVYSKEWTPGSHGGFVWLRLARVWPLHATMLLVLVTYILVGATLRGSYVYEEAYSFKDIPLELLMVRSWGSERLVWNFPAWSIHCEWFAYLCLFPVSQYVLRLIDKPSALAVTLAGLLVANLLLSLPFGGKLSDIVYLFPAGAVLFRLRQRVAVRDSALITYAGIGLLSAALATAEDALFYPSFIALIWGLSYEADVISRLLSTKAAVFGGTISYSIYMTHEVVHKIVNEVISRLGVASLAPGWLLMLLVAIVVLMAACLAHMVIEMPCNTLLRGMVGRSAASASHRRHATSTQRLG